VQVVFGGLALLFAVGFVGFGIGGETSGGIFDAIGLGGDDSGGDVESTYEQQIDDAEKQLESDPKDEKALSDLARYHFLAGQENLSFDEETGVATLTEETRSEWNEALDAWEQLLKQDPKQVDATVASQMVCAYVPPLPVCQVQAPTDDLDLASAAETQRYVAEQDDSPNGYFQLAAFLYFDGDAKGGQEAAQQALSRAEPNQRERLEKELDRLEKDAAEFVKAQEATSGAGAEGEDAQLQNPFGGLGTDTGALPGAAPAP
jgi:tetratricopeptide (TPR) repeat protein